LITLVGSQKKGESKFEIIANLIVKWAFLISILEQQLK
jgi:hypothetical protein